MLFFSFYSALQLSWSWSESLSIRLGLSPMEFPVSFYSSNKLFFFGNLGTSDFSFGTSLLSSCLDSKLQRLHLNILWPLLRVEISNSSISSICSCLCFSFSDLLSNLSSQSKHSEMKTFDKMLSPCFVLVFFQSSFFTHKFKLMAFKISFLLITWFFFYDTFFMVSSED